MSVADVPGLVAKQRAFYRTGKTRDLAFRKVQLTRLMDAVKNHEAEILAALNKDLGKSPEEGYLGEVGFLYEEIRFSLKHLDEWAKPRRVPTPLVTQLGTSWIYAEPLGVSLVIGPWNYPFQLVTAPLVGSLAAGNVCILKPSELSPATSKVIREVVTGSFDPEVVAVFEGGVEASQALLAQKFDHIFFTGGTGVGKVVAEAAAKHLTPCVLELGGKSPCIVDSEVDLETAARRITWGKFFNAGQTCVAPDYLLVPEKLKTPLFENIKKNLVQFFGKDPAQSSDFGRIISDRHFARLVGLTQDGVKVVGGENDPQTRFLAPTVLDKVTDKMKVMEDEIFGPILPVLTYQSLDEAIDFVNDRPKPLALYFFTKNSGNREKVLSEISFGGGCINDTLVHLGNPHLPFGGVGDSGTGAYHGKYGFDTFSHHKSVIKRTFFPDLSLRYPPYAGKMSILKRFIG